VPPVSARVRRAPVLVTGGAGFIGAALVRNLLAVGCRVRILDNLSTGVASHLTGTEVELMRGDVCCEADVDASLAGVGQVVHLAAAGSVMSSATDPVANFEANVVGTFNLLDRARRAGVERVVLASTGGALFGQAEPPVDESTVPSPISPYGASKLAAEGYARAFAHTYKMRTIALRFGNVYGPWSERKRGAVTAFFQAIESKRPIVIYGDGAASRDFIYVDDVAQGIVRSLDADLPAATVMHICSGVETSVSCLAELCRQVAGAPDHPIVYHEKRAVEVVRTFASYDLARCLVGFRPTVDMATGLARTWAWLRDEAPRLREL